MTFSKHFQERMKKLNLEDIPRVIKEDLSSLAEGIAPVVESIVTDVILANVSRWREGYIKTIDDMIAEVEMDLSENSLADKFKDSDRYKTVVKKWTVDTLGKDIALQLKAICEEYNVHEFSLESLNVMTNNVSVNPETCTIKVDPLGGANIGGIIGIITFSSILATIELIVVSIFSTLGALILPILVAIPGLGRTVITAVLGIEMFKLRIIGFEDFKQVKQIFNKKVRRYELPIWVRERVTTDDIEKKISASDIKSKIQAAFLEEENKNKFVEFVSNGITEQIKQRTDAIKFFIESR